MNLFILIAWGGAFLFVIYHFYKSINIVPTQSAYLVERLGRYSQTLGPGFHALIPFLDRVSFRRSLKEMAMDVPPQFCFSKDEINIEVDGVLYLQVVDPVKASYGVTNFREGAIQLAQTTTRAVIGTIDLDKTFEERDLISARVVDVINRAGEAWGVRVQRYEIRNLNPPQSVQHAMEKQVTAEREKRAILADSEGKKAAMINTSEGEMEQMVNVSQGEKQKRINEAEGKAAEILSIARATAESIEKIGAVAATTGGQEALNMQLTEQLLNRFKGLAKPSTRVILPANILDFKAWVNNVGIGGEPGSSGPLTPAPKDKYPGTEVYDGEKGKMTKCPSCGKVYKIDSVLANIEKFDKDKEEPGLQLQCKQCQATFSLKS